MKYGRDKKPNRIRKYEKAVYFEENQTKYCELSNVPTWIESSTRYLDGHKLTKYGQETDSQRQSFYDAEREISSGEVLTGVDAIQDRVDKLTGYRWFERRFTAKQRDMGVERVRRDARHKGLTYHATHGPKIQVAGGDMPLRTLLHELSHTLIRPPHPYHGRLFARIFLELVDWRMGLGDELREAYREHNVSFHPHRERQFVV